MMGEARPVSSIDASAGKQVDAKDTVTAANVPQTVGKDSVFSVLEVDTAVVRSTSSAAPAYPLKLLQSHVQGYVNAQYTVDTTGFADTTSFIVMEATHKEFVQAVKDALPYMRFSPAKIGPMKVRQRVQQQFSFKIADTVSAAPKRRPPA
jgi:protein TonB